MSSIKNPKTQAAKESASENAKGGSGGEKETVEAQNHEEVPKTTETKKGLKTAKKKNEENITSNETNAEKTSPENPGTNAEPAETKKKTIKKKKEEQNPSEQTNQIKAEPVQPEKTDNKIEEEKQSTEKGKKKPAEKSKGGVNVIEVKEAEKANPKEAAAKPTKEKIEATEKVVSPVGKTANGKPKEIALVVKAEPPKQTIPNQAIQLDKNAAGKPAEKPKDQNVPKGAAIQLNPKNVQADLKQTQSKQVVEQKPAAKNSQEPQHQKGKPSSQEVVNKQEEAKGNQKGAVAEIKASEIPEKSKYGNAKGKNQASEVISPVKNDDLKAKNQGPQAPQGKQAPQGVTPKNQPQNEKGKQAEQQSEGSRTTTNKNATKPAELSKFARPQSRIEQAEEQPNSARRTQKTETEKVRMRSFDAGKTDKINANDSFETRTKMWDIRKKERLLEEEKKRLRKETEQCTFSPQLNRKSLNRQTSPSNIYERSVEWSAKVKESLTAKGDELFEEARKPEIKKSRVKSAVGDVAYESKPVRNLYDDSMASKYGATKVNTVQQQAPLDIKGSVNEQVSEINEMFDIITSAIKNKQSLIKAAPKLFEQPQPQPQSQSQLQSQSQVQKSLKNVEDSSKKENHHHTYQPKPVAQKQTHAKAERHDAEVNRIEALKGMLNLKQGPKEKKQPLKKVEGENSEVLLCGTKNAEVLLKENSKRLEIRNNRYVMVDNNISAIEKREIESNNMSLNLEAELHKPEEKAQKIEEHEEKVVEAEEKVEESEEKVEEAEEKVEETEEKVEESEEKVEEAEEKVEETEEKQEQELVEA